MSKVPLQRPLHQQLVNTLSGTYIYVYMFICLYVYMFKYFKRVDINMGVICYASDYRVLQDANSIEK